MLFNGSSNLDQTSKGKQIYMYVYLFLKAPRLIANIFQIKTIKFVTKMDTYIYVHHPGQYWNPDSQSKVSLKTKQKNFMEIFFDHTYTLPKKLEGNKATCRQYNKNYSLDYCMTDVSN